MNRIRFPRNLKPGRPCPLCGVIMRERHGSKPDSLTYDHILPRERGGTLSMHGYAHCRGIGGPTRNRRIVCKHCNELLGQCGHCIGALACVRAVMTADAPPRSERSVLKAWGMYAVAKAASPETRRQDRPTATPGAREAVAVARAVDSIGLDEFCWPADTAARRVWNLATLARKYQGPVKA